MADYKDIISGTIANLVTRVKDAAESANVRGIYEQGSSRAKSLGRIAMLSLELNGDSEELKRVYTEIGRLCYEQYRLSPDGSFAPLFAQAEEISRRISIKEDELYALREELGISAQDGDIDVEIGEFEDVVDATEVYGTAADETVFKNSDF